MAGMLLHKAAHVVNVLALIPALYCAFVAWVFFHPAHYPEGAPKLVNLDAALICLKAFLALFLLSAILSIIALLRGSRQSSA